MFVCGLCDLYVHLCVWWEWDLQYSQWELNHDSCLSGCLLEFVLLGLDATAQKYKRHKTFFLLS